MDRNHLVSERMKEKIDRTTSLLMETGINRFYESFNTFLEKHRAQKLVREEEDDSQALTAGELRVPLTFCSYLLGFALSILLLELIMHKLIMRRNRKAQIRQR